MKRWARYDDQKLLELRLCDLELRVEGSWLERPVRALHRELEARKLRVKPHVWLSQEWFSPGGIPGIAAPFYLAHPRLMRLERKMMGEVEGGSFDACMRILRHEAGHAVQHGFALHRRKPWQYLFGLSSQPYPDSYRPDPKSKKHVLNLELWYAQAHPDEDFAETFAVWLHNRRWEREYAEWPHALIKLVYVDSLMRVLANKAPPFHSRQRIEPLSELKITLGEFYAQKRERYAARSSARYDHDLLRLFERTGKGEQASAFLRKHRRALEAMVLPYAAEHKATFNQVFKELVVRAAELRLLARRPARVLEVELAIVLAMQTAHYIHRGPGRHYL